MAEEEEINDEYLFPSNISCFPTYTYFKDHCTSYALHLTVGFPVIPSNGSYGFYCGREYFIFEKSTNSLSSIISNQSFSASEQDLLTIAYQLLSIANILFSDGKVLKNIHVNDFFLRRTTKGYRVVLLNQDFYNKYVITFPQFTNLVNVMSSTILPSPLFQL